MTVMSSMYSCVPSLEMKFSGVTILQGVEFSIFLLIHKWAYNSNAVIRPKTVKNELKFNCEISCRKTN